jgi:hypothetical protein
LVTLTADDEKLSCSKTNGAGVGRFKYKDLNGDGKITPDDRTFR